MAYTSRARRPSAASTAKAKSSTKTVGSKSKAKSNKTKPVSRKSAPKPAKKPVKARAKAKLASKAKKPARAVSARVSKPAKKPVKALKRGQSSAGLSAVAPLAREVRGGAPRDAEAPATAAPSQPVTAVGSLSIADLLERARPQVHPWSPPLEREHNRLTRRTLAAHHPGFDRRRLKHQGMVAPRGEPSHRTEQRRGKKP